MEHAELALCIAIVIVLILLFSCWKPNKGSGCDVDWDDMEGFKHSRQHVAHVDHDDLHPNQRMKERVRSVSKVVGYDNYGDAAEAMSLDQSVYASHNEFAKAANKSTAGPSALSERSDDQDIIPRVGLRKIDYYSTHSDSSARVDHSEFVQSMPEKTKFTL